MEKNRLKLRAYKKERHRLQVPEGAPGKWVFPRRENGPLSGIESGFSRLCHHVLSGRVEAPKICTRQYECYHCGFDQMLDDMDLRDTGQFADMPVPVLITA